MVTIINPDEMRTPNWGVEQAGGARVRASASSRTINDKIIYKQGSEEKIASGSSIS